jgi:GT2 family glycosyltransferase
VGGLREFAERPIEIIVVDNGGLGRGNVNINPLVPFATAYNAGARAATGDRLLLVNNDIVVSGPYREHIGHHPFEGKTVHPKTRHGGYISGWLLSIDRGLWDLLNGFDEQFRNSFEDVDLSYRARMLGCEFHQINPPIEHLGGKSRRALGAAAARDHKKNKTLFYQKAARMRSASY